MKMNIILCVFVVVLAVAGAQDHGLISPEPPVTTSVPTTPPPSPAPTTKPTTTQPTKPTTSTIPPTTTPSTTTSPTTSPTTSTTTTTTPAPTTPASTTTAPTTTIAPTPKPVNPDIGTWNVTCIVVKMSLHLNITYEKKDNSTGHACVQVPVDAAANGTCGENEQNITLWWPPTNPKNMLFMGFHKNDSEKHFMVDDIVASLFVDSEHFPNATSNETIVIEHNNVAYVTPLHMSYKCTRNESMKFINHKNKLNSTVTINHLQLQAFIKDNSTGFSTAEDCETSGTPGIVPIAVGCTLAALIIIVLGAYLIGRRRSQARGYLSM